jgi:uncharacterized lipoprotein
MGGMKLAVLSLAVLALTGCKTLFKGESCDKPQIYEAAQSQAALKVPAGLEAPDTRAALRIPELNEPARPRKVGDPCLDEPPKFAPPKAVPKDTDAAKPAPATLDAPTKAQ